MNGLVIWKTMFLSAALMTAGAWVRAEEPPAVSTAAASGDPLYVYKLEKVRDPFIPLAGPGMQAVALAAVETDAESFAPASLDLMGIVKARTGRWAILRGSGGTSYMVQNGRIFDSRRRAVENYVAIVKERSLVLMGPNNQVTELKLKKDIEAEKEKK